MFPLSPLIIDTSIHNFRSAVSTMFADHDVDGFVDFSHNRPMGIHHEGYLCTTDHGMAEVSEPHKQNQSITCFVRRNIY